MLRKYYAIIFFGTFFLATKADDEVDVKGGAAEPYKENGVYILTEDNFDSFVEEKDIVLLEFFAPWCGHCKAFAPIYQSVARLLNGKVPAAMIDATANIHLAERYEIVSYPTVKILRNGEVIHYDGAHTEDDLLKKVNELSEPKWSLPYEDVITLTDHNFDSIVGNEDIILVEFYAPWCSHCKSLAPVYEEAARDLQMRNPPIPLARVDTTKELGLAKRFDITSYPTLKIFRRGRAYKFEAGRDKDTIVDYMIQQSEAPSREVNTVQAMHETLHQASDVTIVGCFKRESDPALEAYQVAGNSLRSEYDFHHTFRKDVMKDIGAEVGEVVLFHPERFHSKYEKKRYKHDITGDSTKAELEKFYSEHAVPLVGQRTLDNMRKRYNKRPLVVVYYDVDFSYDHREATQVWRRKVLEVANDMRDVTFAIAKEDDFGLVGEELRKVGLADSPADVNVIAFDNFDIKYPMPPREDFDAEALREFVQDFKAGKIKPKIKSAPKPKKNTRPVKIVVADTFNEIVMDESKDVVLEMHTPWCDECKELKPIFTKVAKKYKLNDNIVFATMDILSNDVPHRAYRTDQGFPVIYWAPSGAKDEPLKFLSEMKYGDIVSFVEARAATSILTKDEL